ncbi:RNA polymerase sporulation sigma factor SigE [Sporolactobacillus spathodeae]|uniref:RNA polymerase sigma factor n=1 Tax=Sporolactobacillus spathodeae TaxID=1465502 RepID=A0ABS2Q917_9BACL|nr:RNA polymerase sporulation-specific sigma factor [Sporolactobacillus spathodeae]
MRKTFRNIWNKLLRLLHLKPEEIYYIGGNDGLPSPLTKEEEAEMMEKLPSGDPKVRETLIEHNLRLVVYIARKFDNTRINIEDLISIGTIGLIKAVNTFNPEKKIKLATYASRCIENEILMYLRRNNRTRSEVSLDEPLNVDWDGNELLLSDVLGTENDITTRRMERKVDHTLLRRAMLMLSDREKEIMMLRFGLEGGKEKTQKDVADQLGISQSYISRLEKRIIKRLKKEFSKMA